MHLILLGVFSSSITFYINQIYIISLINNHILSFHTSHKIISSHHIESCHNYICIDNRSLSHRHLHHKPSISHPPHSQNPKHHILHHKQLITHIIINMYIHHNHISISACIHNDISTKSNEKQINHHIHITYRSIIINVIYNHQIKFHKYPS